MQDQTTQEKTKTTQAPETGDNAFLTPEELIAILWNFCGEDKPESRPALKVSELRQLLNRTNVGQFTPNQIDAGIMEALHRYETHNAGGDGLTFPQIWSFLRRGGDDIPFAMVETRVTELMKAEKIHRRRGGMVTTYRTGKAPEEKAEESQEGKPGQDVK